MNPKITTPSTAVSAPEISICDAPSQRATSMPGMTLGAWRTYVSDALCAARHAASGSDRSPRTQRRSGSRRRLAKSCDARMPTTVATAK